MRSRHYEKFLMNLIQGFIFVTVGIFLIFYSILGGIQKENWYLWALVIAVIINIGLLSIGVAFVHKIKSDFNRKHRSQKEKEEEEEFQEYTLEK